MLLNKYLNKNINIKTNKQDFLDVLIDADKDGIMLESGIYIPMNNIIYIKFV
jgi:hypothetical protein